MSSAYGVMIKQKDKEGFVFVLALTNFLWPCQGLSLDPGLGQGLALPWPWAPGKRTKAQDLS